MAFLWIPRRLVQPQQWMCGGWCMVPEYEYVKVFTCVCSCGSQSKTVGIFLHCSLPYCLEKGSVIGPETFLRSWLTVRFWDPNMSTPTTLGLQAHKVLPGYLHGYWRFELRSLYWRHKGSYRAISAAPSHSSLMTVVSKSGHVLLRGFLWKHFSFTAF